MKNSLKLLFLLTFACNISFAQSITFNEVWVDQNVIMDGSLGVIFHASFEIRDLKGKRCEACIYIQTPDGEYVKDLNGRYHDKEGDVCFTYKFRPKYQTTIYNNMWIFFPYSEMHMNGSSTYYIAYLSIYDNHNNRIGYTRDFSIDANYGTVARNGNYNNNNSFNQTYNNVMQNATDIYNQGMNTISNIYKSAEEASKNPDLINKLGQEAQSTGVYYNNNYNNSSTTTPTRKTCPDCNGKRYRPESYTDCAVYTSYQNQAGTTCYICGYSHKHCHYPCTTCQQRGTVESY